MSFSHTHDFINYNFVLIYISREFPDGLTGLKLLCESPPMATLCAPPPIWEPQCPRILGALITLKLWDLGLGPRISLILY